MSFYVIDSRKTDFLSENNHRKKDTTGKQNDCPRNCCINSFKEVRYVVIIK